jgi:8-oxo-dGTP pyrophosphatase MutT (NUDIX family)
MILHPRNDNHGAPVSIKHPHTPSPSSSWTDPLQIATAVPGATLPVTLNGIAQESWTGAPKDRAGWMHLCQTNKIDEPPFDPMGKNPSAGTVILEADGRVWLVAPTNQFGGYQATFPKGHVSSGMNFQATAVKETFEEAGLRVKLTAHLIDVTRSTTRTRYYLARRVGGNPADMDWESQAVLLAPMDLLHEILKTPYDQAVIEALHRYRAQGN